MTQSSFLFAVLLVAFVLFLAANDRLRTYLGVLWGKTSGAKPGSGGQSGGGGVSLSDAEKAAQIILMTGGL